MGEHRNEALRFVSAFFVEQFFALVHSENNGQRRRSFARGCGHLRDGAQRGKNLIEPAFCRLNKLLDGGATAWEAALANLVGESRLAHDTEQCLCETELTRQYCAFGPDNR